jgi:hypothetical protein
MHMHNQLTIRKEKCSDLYKIFFTVTLENASTAQRTDAAMNSIASECTTLASKQCDAMPMCDDSRKFRHTFDSVMMLDAAHPAAAAPLKLMHTSDWFKSKVEAMRTESIVEYVVYSRLLKHPECPVQVERLNRNGGGYLTSVTLGCRKFDWNFPYFDEEKKEELRRKKDKAADLWTHKLDATVTMSVDAQNQPCKYVMDLKPPAQQISAYKIVSTLCDTFEDLKSMEYMCFDLCMGGTSSDINISVTFALPAAPGVKCVLAGSFVLPPQVANDWKRVECGNDLTHFYIDDPKCKWSKVMLHTPWSKINEMQGGVEVTSTPVVKTSTYSLDVDREPNAKRMRVCS